MALLENIAPPCSINIGSVSGGLMNRTTATCIAGTRSKSHEQDQNPFFPETAWANPFTRRFFAFGAGIFAKRPLGRTERNPLS